MLKIIQYYIICDYTVYYEYVICYLNLEKEAVIDSDDNINNDDKDEKIENKKKKHQKKSEEKTSKQDDVRHFLIV